MAENTNVVLRNENDLKVFLANNYMNQIKNFFGDEKQALKFLSSVMASVQKLPALLDCAPITVINSFMTMAQLGFMPSSVSGEAYVLPYKNKGVMEAQFQLGYQGIVTLLYGAGNKEVITELVREKDLFTISRGKVTHFVDPKLSKAERGDWYGAYAIIVTATGGTIEQYMTKKDIMDHAKKYSKSFTSEYSPWNESNDREGWMPRKTVLKQTAKLAPKNEKLNIAIAEDNKDSRISDVKGMVEAGKLNMGNFLKDGKENQNKKADAKAPAGENADGKDIQVGE